VFRERPELKARLARKASKASKEYRVSRAILETQGQLGHKARQGLKALREYKVFKARPD
jgi:hypothetical protein